MGGLFLDVFVELLCRGIMLLARSLRSERWPEKNARVTSSERTRFACDVARISYAYEVTGITYEGNQAVPFLSRDSAEDYLRHRGPGTIVVIRVNPANPSKSFLLDRVVSAAVER